MSGISATADFARLAARLLRKAEALAMASAARAALARSAPERVWRRADLLWPGFANE